MNHKAFSLSCEGGIFSLYIIYGTLVRNHMAHQLPIHIKFQLELFIFELQILFRLIALNNVAALSDPGRFPYNLRISPGKTDIGRSDRHFISVDRL